MQFQRYSGISLVILCSVLVFELCESLKCPGSCISKEDCKNKKGKIRGYCSNEKPCCDLQASYTGSCNDKMTGLSKAIFQSPMYPSFLSRDLTCSFDLVLDENYQAILIEFVDVFMNGIGFIPHSQCEGGMLILSGFGLWRPIPLCGNLTGYAVLIDKSPETEFLKTLRILGVMTGKMYKWKIKITQIIKAPQTTTTESPVEEDEENELVSLSNIISTRETPEFTEIDKNLVQFETQITSPSADMGNAVVLDDIDEEDQSAFEISEPLIQNGVDTNISVVPWQASLRHVYPDELLNISQIYKDLNKEGKNCTDNGKHFCGGSIISDRHILTAAHCIGPQSKLAPRFRLNEIHIFLGDTNLCLDDGVHYGQPSQVYLVEQIIFHYNYDDEHLINDVAVIKLKDKIKFADYIKPIRLPPKYPKDKTPSYDGKPAKFSGWGLTNLTHRQKLPMVLQYTEEITVQNKSTCDEILKRQFHIKNLEGKYKWVYESTLCTNATVGSIKAANLGQGDSGGPLYTQEKAEDEPVQIGIASYMVRGLEPKDIIKEQSLADFYASVAFFRSWIDFVIGAK